MPRIQEIWISDTYGVQNFHVGPFSVLRIFGDNGNGKSSILRSLAYIFAGGTSPDCIRKGAEKSEVKFVLDDGTEVVKTTRPKRNRKNELTGYVAETIVTQADGTPRPAPQSYIQELGSALSVDPSFLLRIDSTTAPGRKVLCDQLLKLVPLEFSPEEVNDAVSYRASIHSGRADTIALPQSLDKPLSLDELKKAVESVTEQRRRIGIQRDDADGACNRLRAGLPQTDGVDWTVAVNEAEEYRRKVESAMADTKLEHEKIKSAALSVAQQRLWDAQAEANRIFNAAMEAAAAKFATDKQAATDAYNANIEALEAESRPVLDAAIEDLTQKKAGRDAELRATSLKQEIERNFKLFRANAYTYDRLTEVLQRLDKLRLDKLAHLPVAGLLVENGEAFLDGVEWHNVNTERKIEAILQICSLNSGKLPLILWDDAEHATAKNRGAIEQGFISAGYQLIEAVVSERSGLTIEVVQ